MKNFSLNKNKRGRPIKLDCFKHDQEYYQKNNPGVTSKRGLYNKYYVEAALYGVIFDNAKALQLKKPEYEFLVKIKGKGFKAKETILAEIGRIHDKYSKEDAVFIADEICKRKMNTAKTITWIRSSRGFQKNKIDNTVKKLLSVLENSFLTEDEAKEALDRFDTEAKFIDYVIKKQD